MTGNIAFTADYLTAFLLAIIPAILSIGMAVYVFFKRRQRTDIKLLILMMAISGCWQLGSALMRLSPGIREAMFWDDLFRPLGLIGPAITLHFVLYLAYPKLKDKWKKLIYLLYLFSFILVRLYPTFNSLNAYDRIPFWGFVNRQDGLYNVIVSGFHAILYTAVIIILTNALVKERRRSNYYYQLLLLDCAIVFVIGIAIITEAVFPLVLHIDPFPVTPTTLVAVNLAAFIALTRFDLFKGEEYIHKKELLGMISDIVIVLNASLKIAYINNKGLEYTQCAAHELEDQHITKVLSLQNGELTGAGNSYAAETNEYLTGNLISCNGRIIPVGIKVHILNDEKGKEGILLICHEKSDSERASEEVKRNERRFTKIIEKSKDVIALLDSNGVVKYITPSVYTVTGYTQKEVIGVNFLDFVHAGSRQSAGNTFAKNLSIKEEEEGKQGIYKVKHKDGSTIWIENSSTNLFGDPDINALVAVFRDVTQRVKAEQRMLDNQRLLEQAQEIGHMGNWIAELTEDGNSWWSKEALSIYGMTTEEFDGKAETYFRFVHPDDINRMYEVSGKAIQEHATFSLEHRIVLKDGTIKWVYNRAFAEYENGQAVRLIGIVQDITSRKLAENELLKKNEELTQINKELDQFVYSASHDIRSPIMSILGLVNIAEDEISDPSAAEYFKMIEATALKLDEFTMEIINWSRNRRGDISPDIIDVTAIVRDIVESLRHQKIARNVEFLLNAKPFQPFVTDKLRLQIILSNLISNAIIYQKPDATDGYVKISSSVDADETLWLEVEDNGVGIDENNLSKIFGMFTRLSDNSRGSGLGLYIVREAVEKLQGSLNVTSEAGTGSKFTVSIPSIKDI